MGMLTVSVPAFEPMDASDVSGLIVADRVLLPPKLTIAPALPCPAPEIVIFRVAGMVTPPAAGNPKEPPGLTTTGTLGKPMAESLAAVKMPPLIVVVPLYVLVPESVTVPAPCLMTLLAMTPALKFAGETPVHMPA